MADELTEKKEKETLVTINNEKENSLTFQVNVKGVDAEHLNVRFVIESKKMCLTFICESSEENDYKVIIPPLPFFDLGTHDCKIEVIANEYFFVAMDGKIKIAGTPNVKAKVKEEQQIEESSPMPVITVQEIRVNDEEQSEIDVVEETVEQPVDKNKAVSNILESMGFKSTPTKYKSLKTFLKS